MTLNQVLRRIEKICLAHKQVRRFRVGLNEDMFTDKTAKYAACMLTYQSGSISSSGHSATISFRLIAVDMVHVSEDAKDNQDEVLSDMLSVIMDVMAMLNWAGYNDWAVSKDNQLQALIEEGDDMYAGWAIDFSIKIMWDQNVCQIPSETVLA